MRILKCKDCRAPTTDWYTGTYLVLGAYGKTIQCRSCLKVIYYGLKEWKRYFDLVEISSEKSYDIPDTAEVKYYVGEETNTYLAAGIVNNQPVIIYTENTGYGNSLTVDRSDYELSVDKDVSTSDILAGGSDGGVGNLRTTVPEPLNILETTKNMLKENYK